MHVAADLLARDVRPWPSQSALHEREAAFLRSCDPAALAAAVRRPATWATPDGLWAALATTTPLARLAGYGRDPARNRLPDGHVQSQAEHTVALLEGLHALRRGDVAWFRARAATAVDGAGTAVLAALAGWLGRLGDATFRALLLAGAFHDAGKLVGDVPGVDAENGVHLYTRLLDRAGAGAPFTTVGAVLVRFHDLVRHHGDAGMLSFMATTAGSVGAGGRGCAAALAGIQVAGRASIGHRRLDAATLTAMAALLGAWPARRPTPVRLTVHHGGAGRGLTTTAVPAPAPPGTIAHVVAAGAPAAPVTLLNGARCSFVACGAGARPAAPTDARP